MKWIRKTISIDKELYNLIKLEVKRKGLTFSGLIKFLLESYLEGEER